MKNFTVASLLVVGLLLASACFAYFGFSANEYLQKRQSFGAGFYTQLSQNFQQYYATSTLGVVTTTLATIPITAVTSTEHLVIDVSANAASSTDGAGYHCVADWKRSSSTVDNIFPIGTTQCTSNESASLWDVAVTTTPGNIVVNISGQAATTINWGALIYSLNVR